MVLHQPVVIRLIAKFDKESDVSRLSMIRRTGSRFPTYMPADAERTVISLPMTYRLVSILTETDSMFNR